MVMVLLASWAGVYAQNSPVTPGQIRQAYQQFEYERTVSLGERYLENHPRIDKTTLLQVLQYTTFAQVALGRDEDAQRTIRSILVTDPTFEPDEKLASPKVERMFADLRSELTSSETTPEIQPSHLILQDVKTGAALRSIIFPGAGQRYLDQNRGFLYVGVAGVSLGIFLYSAFRLPSARKAYLKASDPKQIESKYDEYNRWYHYRNNSLIAYASSWSLSVIDVLIFGPSTQPVFSVQPHQSGVEFALNLHW